MDVERIALFAGMGFALAVGAFVIWGPAPRPRKRGRVIGIANIGYTCFLNSLLQSLAACPIFTTWLRNQHKKGKPDSFTSTLMKALDNINGFCDDLYSEVAPVEIISSLGSMWSFAPGHQDAHELLHVFLSALQTETQKSYRKGCLSDALLTNPPVIADMRGSGDPLSLRSVSCNDITAVNKNVHQISPVEKNFPINITPYTLSTVNISSTTSIKPGMILARSSEIISGFNGGNDNGDVSRPWSSMCTIPLSSIPSLSNKVHPFSGLLTSQLQCTECKWKSSVRYDKLESVSLPLPPSSGDFVWRRHTLTELLSRLVSSEIIHDVECDGCSNRCAAYKTLTFGKLPKCLCLHIPRTTWSSSGVAIKRDDPVIFLEFLILDPFTFAETKKRNNQNSLQTMMYLNGQSKIQGRHKYKLNAVIEHRGPVDSGHFVCYRRGNRPGQWLYTSDTTVEKSSLNDVLHASPYLLFYERISSSQE